MTNNEKAQQLLIVVGLFLCLFFELSCCRCYVSTTKTFRVQGKYLPVIRRPM
nr:MAG TPA: hypothetical protein [Ackermannviridae sp.]